MTPARELDFSADTAALSAALPPRQQPQQQRSTALGPAFGASSMPPPPRRVGRSDRFIRSGLTPPEHKRQRVTPSSAAAAVAQCLGPCPSRPQGSAPATASSSPASGAFQLPRFECPIPNCQKDFSDSAYLVRHLQNHLQRGVTVPDEVLQALRKVVCPRCRVMRPVSMEHCPCNVPQPPESAGPMFSGESDARVVAALQEFASAPRTLHHIPNGAQDAVAALFVELLQKANSRRSVEDVVDLVAMPRVVLRPLARGGMKHEAQAARLVCDRVDRWRAGARSMEEAPSAPPKTRPPCHIQAEGPLPPEIERRVEVATLRERALSKGVKILLSAGSPEADPVEVRTTLLAKHPPGPETIPSVEPEATEGFDITADTVRQATASFPPASGGGPSGLRPEHIKEMMRSSHSEKVAEALGEFCSAFLNGHLPEATMPLFRAARCIGLSKPGGGVRPIAMGDTLRPSAG